ncbi:MAG: hypothetical protein R2864_00710 [Syntrophotaleaceae bacterium]
MRGYQSPKWLGRCPDCGQWNTLTEELRSALCRGRPVAQRRHRSAYFRGGRRRRRSLLRHHGEFDRVLGGGVVPGSLVLIGGDPGIGGVDDCCCRRPTDLPPGVPFCMSPPRESARQIKLRGARLGVKDGNYCYLRRNLPGSYSRSGSRN